MYGKREAFSLFKKTLSTGKKIWYYIIYNDLGKRKQYSTGERTKARAKDYCLKLYKKGNMTPQKRKTFKEFTKDWFIYDQCPYIQAKLLRGHHYDRAYADLKRNQLQKHLLPTFGIFYLDQITPVLTINYRQNRNHQF